MGKDVKARNPGNIVVVGGGIVGVCTAYFLAISPHRPKGSTITLVEANAVACAASGNAGGFLARDWHPSETASESSFLDPSSPSIVIAPMNPSAGLLDKSHVACLNQWNGLIRPQRSSYSTLWPWTSHITPHGRGKFRNSKPDQTADASRLVCHELRSAPQARGAVQRIEAVGIPCRRHAGELDLGRKQTTSSPHPFCYLAEE